MDLLGRAAALLQEGETFCLATVIGSPEEAPPLGSHLLVRDSGVEGTLGSPELDQEVSECGRRQIAARHPEVVTLSRGLRVFLDVLSREDTLLVCGAGHIALPLARFAREVGFRVTVLDDREDYAHPSRFPGCRVIAEDFVAALRPMTLGPNSYVVVITRGHEHDSECLTEVLPKPTAYVGMIGSRRRIRFVLEQLAADGISRDRLEQVFTPIGLPIGAESPEEIALAICAELTCVRRRGPRQALCMREAISP